MVLTIGARRDIWGKPFQGSAMMTKVSARASTKGCGQGGRNLTYGMLEHLGVVIVTGYYAARPFPTEAELTKDHGVSRSVTREAVKMLTAKGLLSARASGHDCSAIFLLEPVRRGCAALDAGTYIFDRAAA